MLSAPRFGLQPIHGRARRTVPAQPSRHHVAGRPAEHGRVGDAVAVEPIGTMHAAWVVVGNEQPGSSIEVSTLHTSPPEMVHIGHHLNEAAGKIEAGQYIESQLLLMFATNTIFDCFLQ